jgi:hypothetical protein
MGTPVIGLSSRLDEYLDLSKCIKHLSIQQFIA